MEKFIQLLEEFIIKAIELTETAMTMDLLNSDKLENFTENRDRLFLIIDQISKQIDWSTVSQDSKDSITKQIDFIKKLDEKMLVKLQELRETLKSDIETTFRQKENIKGYNLNDVKQR